jgi:6-phosphogluconolactonase
MLMAAEACSSDQTPAEKVPTTDGNYSEDATANDASDTRVDAGNLNDAPAPVMKQLLMITANGDGKIYLYSVNESSFELTERDSIAVGTDPSFAAMDPKGEHIYVVDEGGGGTVHSFSMNPSTYALTALGAPVASGGAGPTHLSVDPSGSYVLVANYSAGTSAVFPIDPDGSLGAASDVKNSGSKAHLAISNPSGGYAYVPCLGSNWIAQYTFQGGQLSPLSPANVTLPNGAGPRHMDFRRDEMFAYSINELNSTVSTFAFDKASGKLSRGETVSSLPKGFSGSNTGAELTVHPSGNWVYVSNRGHNSIATFASDRTTGALTLVSHDSTEGNTPRSFGLDPQGQWLVAANQESDSLKAYRIDASTGRLSPITGTLTSPSPTYVGLFRR